MPVKIGSSRDDGQLFCVESQEWTYGLDNTGTRFSDTAATYCLELSDGSTVEWSQTATANWAAQLTEWAANIQTAADSAGLQWFVEPRFVDNPNPPNIDGTINGPGGTPSGLPGAPTPAIAEALIADGMAWRYVNFQICPGQPVPVRAYRKTSDLYGDELYELNTAGAILGPIKEFWVCADCDGKDSGSLLWLKKDPENPQELIPAEAGEIPNCYEPCGTLALADAPPDRDCQFEIDVACDNNNSDQIGDFTNTITRRATICNGEQIAVDYFQADPNDAGALVDYELVGDFVDCASGIPIEPPEVQCDKPDIDFCLVSGCESALRASIGRPNNGVTWTLTESDGTIITGDTYTEFAAAMESAGYCEYISGPTSESHRFCPFPEGATLTIDGVVDEMVEISYEDDQENWPKPPVYKCVEWSVGKNDDRRDDILQSISDGQPDLVECVEGGGDSQSDPVTHTVQDNNTDYTWSYNQTSLKLQGQSPFNSPDAAPFFDAIVSCINDDGGIAKITFTNPDGIVGTFNADTVVNDGYTTGFFTGQGDTALLQSGKVSTASMVCCTDGSEAVTFKAEKVSVCGLDEIKAKLCAIENNTSPPTRIQIEPLCDLVDGVSTQVFVQYTLTQGQPILTEVFSDAALTQIHPVQGVLVDCITLEPAEPPQGICDDFELATVWSLSELTGTLRSRDWDLGPRPTSFMSVESGKAIRENFDFTAATTIDQDWNTIHVDDTNSSGTIQDAQVVEGFIKVDQPMMLRWASGSAGYFALELGKCCGPLELVLEGATAEASVNPTSPISISPGIHAIRMWNIDDWTNTARTAQYSLDGGVTWTSDNTPPGIERTRVEPQETCKQIKVCKPSGEFRDLFTDEIIGKASCYACPIKCTPTATASEPTPATHIIEGCITDPDNANNKISSYTVVDEAGEPLFEPRPITDTGLEECC